MQPDLPLEDRLNIIRETAEPIKKLAADNELVSFLYRDAFHITFNANDTFGWACADSVEVAIGDLPKLLEVRKLYGYDGVNAFLALVDGSNVIEPLETKKYKEAQKFLKGYRPLSWVG